MTRYVYCFYSYKVGCYSIPMFRFESPEDMVEAVKRDYITGKDVDRVAISECELYYLGTFDDKKGVFVLHETPQSLIDLRSLAHGGNQD